MVSIFYIVLPLFLMLFFIMNNTSTNKQPLIAQMVFSKGYSASPHMFIEIYLNTLASFC